MLLKLSIMIKKITIIIILITVATQAFPQRYLLFENVDKELEERNTNYGPNKRHFIYPYLMGGQILGNSNDSLPVNYLQSGSFGVGFKYKHKLTSWWSHGVELAYHYQDFGIAQKEIKSFPDTLEYKKEKLKQHQLAGTYFWRFRLGRAGNYLGKYLDIGAFGAWTFAGNHMYITDENVQNGKEMKVKVKQPDYMEPIEYGVMARIGVPRVSLYGKYRLSTLIKDQNGKSWELPAVTVGMELNLTK